MPSEELVGLREVGMVDDGRWVEDGDVGEVARLEEPTVFEVFALGGQRSDLCELRIRVTEMLATDVAAEEARHRTHGARMGVRLI